MMSVEIMSSFRDYCSARPQTKILPSLRDLLFLVVILFKFDELTIGIIGKEVKAVEVFGEG